MSTQFDIESTCPSCNEFVSDDDAALCCEGNCGRWFHCACLDISKSHCDMFTALEDVAIWLCPVDKLEMKRWIASQRLQPVDLDKTQRDNFKAIEMDLIVDHLDEIRDGMKGIDLLKTAVQELTIKLSDHLVVPLSTSPPFTSSNHRTSNRRTGNHKKRAKQTIQAKVLTTELSSVACMPVAVDSLILPSPAVAAVSDTSTLVPIPTDSSDLPTNSIHPATTPSYASIASCSEISDITQPLENGKKSTSAILTIIKPPRVIFLSRLQYGTKPSDILRYIETGGIDTSFLKCFCLTPADLPDRITASFKLIVPENIFDRLMARKFWPDKILINEFKPRPRKVPASKN